MMHYKEFSRGARHFLLCSILALGAMVMTSCGDDEPSATVIDYYVEVEEEFLINSSSDLIDRYYNPRDMMREVIRAAYPKPDIQGNDQAVIDACDELYYRYYSMYSGREDHLTCKLHLVRARMEGKIVRQSERLRTYVFDVNPAEIEE